jgi:ATP-binding cassette, subfamily B, bacterial
MKILWKYLRLQRWLIAVSLALAGTSRLLSLVDPIFFGKIIDDYATRPGNRPEDELVRGVLWWLGVAVAIALLARVAKSFQEYLTRLAVQKFGM